MASGRVGVTAEWERSARQNVPVVTGDRAEDIRGYLIRWQCHRRPWSHARRLEGRVQMEKGSQGELSYGIGELHWTG